MVIELQWIVADSQFSLISQLIAIVLQTDGV